MKRTTAEMPPGNATVLEEFTYVGIDDDRLLQRRQRVPIGGGAYDLVVVEEREYSDFPFSGYHVVVRYRVDALFEQVHVEI